MRIIYCRTPFKIIDIVIGLALVPVIHHWKVVWIRYKSHRYKSMYFFLHTFRILCNNDITITFIIFL